MSNRTYLLERVGPAAVVQLYVDAFADLDVPIERITMARRFARSHLNGMVVQRQMASVEPEPDAELELLCDAVLGILTRPSA